MRKLVVIEDIETMRLREGIDDAELREQVRGLRVGDFVRLTFLSGVSASTGETLLVRVTRIQAGALRGKLADEPRSAGLSDLRIGLPVAFTASHIHSVPRREANR